MVPLILIFDFLNFFCIKLKKIKIYMKKKIKEMEMREKVRDGGKGTWKSSCLSVCKLENLVNLVKGSK